MGNMQACCFNHACQILRQRGRKLAGRQHDKELVQKDWQLSQGQETHRDHARSTNGFMRLASLKRCATPTPLLCYEHNRVEDRRQPARTNHRERLSSSLTD
eukprot:1564805-Amphidinium_carterae.1